MSTSTSSSLSSSFRSVYVTANTDPDDSAYIASRPDILLLSNAKLCSSAPRKMGARKVSNVLTEISTTATSTVAATTNPQNVSSVRKVAALFESQMLEIVYPIRVQESKFQQASSTGVLGDTSIDASSSTAATINASMDGSSVPATAAAAAAAAPRLWCNAVFRCPDEHVRSSMGLLDNEIAKIFPPVFLNGFRNGINSVESMLTADKDDPQQIPCLLRMDVPFDDITRTLTVFAVDENNMPIEEPLTLIPSGTRCKAIFAAEMVFSEKPVKRVHIRLTLQQIALLDSINSAPTFSASLFRMVGEPTSVTTTHAVVSNKNSSISSSGTTITVNDNDQNTNDVLPGLSTDNDVSKDSHSVTQIASTCFLDDIQQPKAKKIKQ